MDIMNFENPQQDELTNHMYLDLDNTLSRNVYEHGTDINHDQLANIYARGHSPDYSISPSSSTEGDPCWSDHDNSLDWLSSWNSFSMNSSPATTPPAPSTPTWSPTPSPKYYSSWLPGTLSQLPLELIFNIFDELLIGHSPRLTHEGLHTIRSLRNANKHTKAMVSAYLKREPILIYLRQQLQDWDDDRCAKWYRSHPDAFVELMQPSRRRSNNSTPTQDSRCDIITEVIVDDCPDCFDSLCRAIPGLGDAHAGCNENGWTFIAIAIRSGSYRMLERLFSAYSAFAYESPSLVLMSSANCLQASPTGFGMLAYQQDPVFVERVLDLVGPVILRNNLPGVLTSVLDSVEKAMLCKYITVRAGEWLRYLNIELWKHPNGSDSVWHSAIHNGPEFLDFLYRYNPEGIHSPTSHGSLPIYHAVWANRLDSFQWLLSMTHASGHELELASGAMDRTGYVVANHTSAESEIMLDQILPNPGLHADNYFTAGKYFQNIVGGMKEIVLTQAVRSDLDGEAYRLFREEHEQRAIRKCHAVSRVFTDTGYRMAGYFKLQANALHSDAVVMARQLGFEDLERALYWYHGL